MTAKMCAKCIYSRDVHTGEIAKPDSTGWECNNKDIINHSLLYRRCSIDAFQRVRPSTGIDCYLAKYTEPIKLEKLNSDEMKEVFFYGM